MTKNRITLFEVSGNDWATLDQGGGVEMKS